MPRTITQLVPDEIERVYRTRFVGDERRDRRGELRPEPAPGQRQHLPQRHERGGHGHPGSRPEHDVVEPESDQRAARHEPGHEAQPDRGVRRAPTEPEIEQRGVGRERADDRKRLVRRQRQRFAAHGEVVADRLCKTIFHH